MWRPITRSLNVYIKDETEMINEIGNISEKKMRYSKVYQIMIVFILVLMVTTIFLQVCQLGTREYRADEIYRQASEYVIEIKATQGEHTAYGSGVIYNKEGYVITNYHVVSYLQGGQTSTMEKIESRFSNKQEYCEMSLVGFDEENDIAILKFNEEQSYHYAKCSKDNKLKSGSKVFAVGNTSNFGLSISEGIVGVPLVNIEYADKIRTVIQCDLSIAEGNSGGALIDGDGILVGITTFRIKDKNGSIVYGIAYCVPIDIVDNIITNFVGEGKK